ncbi:hypothetical protein C8D82_13023 [Victivallis vadensis]|uniref:Uncharacterized protein n=1 Tax=Victivallis vadensis TaxID=172901 RepID=A0A2U1AN84_9BACT|nr:hypothetical protein C8D82_13023 [Victivallis vadensis]
MNRLSFFDNVTDSLFRKFCKRFRIILSDFYRLSPWQTGLIV